MRLVPQKTACVGEELKAHDWVSLVNYPEASFVALTVREELLNKLKAEVKKKASAVLLSKLNYSAERFSYNLTLNNKPIFIERKSYYIF